MAEAFTNISNMNGNLNTDSQSDINASNGDAPRKSTRGFASMDPAKQKEIARKGGRAAHMKGTAHEFTPDEARAAGRKGGEAVSRDRAHMAQIGREGGQARGARAALRAQQEAASRAQAHSHDADRGSFGSEPSMGGNGGGFNSGTM